MQTDCCTPQSVTSAAIKSVVACGAACGDAGTHNVCAHRMSQDEGFVIITVSFGRETSHSLSRLALCLSLSAAPLCAPASCGTVHDPV